VRTRCIAPLLPLVVAILAASAASASDAGAWTGTIEGTLNQTDHQDNQASNPADRVVTDDAQVYHIRFTFGFRIAPDGSIVGTGQGEYLEATWHLEGTNGGQAFSCDPPISVPPTFDVVVAGQASGRSLSVEFRLQNVFESNQDVDCGAGFTAYAGETHKIIDSMNTSGARIITLDETNPSLAPIYLHEDIPGTTKTTTRDHAWTFDIKHACAGSDYSDPSSSGYINQYDAGNALDLPSAYGQKGGNSCGPSSLAMLVDAFKRGAGAAQFPGLKDLYDATVSDGNFTWAQGLGTAYSMGFYEAVEGSGIDQINAWLAAGVPVLASTTFGSGAWGNPGGGHVILITGRTGDGDYVVSDPAGDYYSSSSNHYGGQKCGDNVVYPKAGVEANAADRPMLAIPNHAGADPQALVAVGRAPGGGRGEFLFWLEDGLGRKVGWPESVAPLSQIPTSWAGLDPVVPSSPDAPAAALDPSAAPYAAVLLLPVADLVLRVQSLGPPADYEILLRTIQNGRLVSSTLESGTLGAGETRTLPIPEPDAPLAGLASIAALFLIGRHRASRARGRAVVSGPTRGPSPWRTAARPRPSCPSDPARRRGRRTRRRSASRRAGAGRSRPPPRTFAAARARPRDCCRPARTSGRRRSPCGTRRPPRPSCPPSRARSRDRCASPHWRGRGAPRGSASRPPGACPPGATRPPG